MDISRHTKALGAGISSRSSNIMDNATETIPVSAACFYAQYSQIYGRVLHRIGIAHLESSKPS